jgi:hypothetical protein
MGLPMTWQEIRRFGQNLSASDPASELQANAWYACHLSRNRATGHWVRPFSRQHHKSRSIKDSLQTKV